MFTRVPHRVLIERLEQEWHWTTANGDSLTAQAGDYRVTDSTTGSEWSITPVRLANGYRHVVANVYESRGTVSARQLGPGAPPEDITTSEGIERAHPGEWVVTDSDGNSWVVDPEHFTSHYR